MKIRHIKFRPLYLFILVSFIVSTNSCNSKEEEELPQTFLEMYDGTVWVSTPDEGVSYTCVKFHNNLSNFLDEWSFNSSSDCYYFSGISEDTFEIIENSSNSFVFKILGGESEYYTITLSIKDDILSVNSGGDLMDLKKTSINMDDLEICD